VTSKCYIPDETTPSSTMTAWKGLNNVLIHNYIPQFNDNIIYTF